MAFDWGSTYYRTDRENEPPLAEGEGPIPLNCPICGVHTNAPIVCRTITPSSSFVRLPTIEMQVYTYLVKCTRCRSGLLVLWAWGTNPLGDHGSGKAVGPYIFPPPTSAFETEGLRREAIPKAIFEDLRQAELSYLAQSDYGAGLLLRRACQYICIDKKATGESLKAQISDLAAKGVITKSLEESAHALRIIGNELAHPDPSTPFVITGEDVREARLLLEQLVRAVYVDPERTKKLREGLRDKGVKGA